MQSNTSYVGLNETINLHSPRLAQNPLHSQTCTHHERYCQLCVLSIANQPTPRLKSNSMKHSDDQNSGDMIPAPVNSINTLTVCTEVLEA